jgi:hypothetical protein
MTSDRLLARLDGVRRSGKDRWMARCPAHHDRHASLAIREEQDGRVLNPLLRRCTPEAVLAALGLDWRDLFPPKALDHAPPVQRPWRLSDVVRALEFELDVAYLILADVSNGGELSIRIVIGLGLRANVSPISHGSCAMLGEDSAPVIGTST